MMGATRAAALSKQFIFDDQLHFVRDDYGWEGILGIWQYAAVGRHCRREGQRGLHG